MTAKSVAVIILALAAAPAALAQTQANTGQIEGAVTDASGGGIPAARVQIRHLGTNQARDLAADQGGFYRAALLQIGPYEISVEASGFAPYKQTGINLSTGQILTLNVRLDVAAAQQAVTVTSDAAIVETARVTTSRAVNQMDVENLPNLSRSELNFAFLQPFINGNRPREYEAPRLDFGGLARRLNYQVDGFQNSAAQQKAYRVIIFSPAVLQETQVASFGANAEYGRTGGGVVNNIIKSGTNQFHGQAEYITARKSWNALPYRSLPGNEPSGNVWIGAIGGPVRRDRLFFFAGYEASRRAFPQSLGFTSPAARDNASALGFTGKEVDVLPSSFNPQLWLAKFDYRPRPRHALVLRGNTFREFFYARDPGGNTVLSSSNGAIFNEAAAALAWTATLSAGAINEFRFQLADRFSRRRPVVEPGPQTLPRTVVSGVATFGYPSGLTANREKILEWSDNLTHQAGEHQIKGGFNVVHSPLNAEDEFIPTFTFGGLTAAGGRGPVTALQQYQWAREARIDPATGRPFTYTQLSTSFGERVLRLHQVYYGLYFQDQWRLRRGLTLHYGARWETVAPPEPDSTSPHPLSQQFRRDRNNLAPRFGFAWAPRGSEKLVLRGSYGLHYDYPQSNLYRDALRNNGRSQISIQVAGTAAGAPVYPNAPASPAGFPAVRSSLTVIDPDFSWMYVHQAQLGVERELGRDFSLSLTWAFTKGTKIPLVQNINLAAPTGRLADGRPIYGSARLNPAFNNINMITAAGNSNYNGLGVLLNRRFAGGLQFSLSYTWSHALDNTPEPGISGGGEQPQDSFNRRAEYGNAVTDVRHVLNGSAVWRPRFRNPALDNNQLALFFFARSGGAYDVRTGADLNVDSVNNDRPLYVGRNTGRGPSAAQFDLRYTRFVPLGRERMRLQLMVEAANLFNTPNADSTNTAINRVFGTGSTPLATLGQVLTYHEMRRLQAGVRLDF
ncbi:MAG: TonB-dependent receptor [Acidobacteriota bacterium]